MQRKTPVRLMSTTSRHGSREILEVDPRRADAGVVEEDVEAAEGLARPSKSARTAAGSVTFVGTACDRSRPPPRRRRSSAQRLAPAPGEDDAIAFIQHSRCDGFADPGARARHDCDLGGRRHDWRRLSVAAAAILGEGHARGKRRAAIAYRPSRHRRRGRGRRWPVRWSLPWTAGRLRCRACSLQGAEAGRLPDLSARQRLPLREAAARPSGQPSYLKDNWTRAR